LKYLGSYLLFYDGEYFKLAKWNKSTGIYLIEIEYDIESGISNHLCDSLLSDFLRKMIRDIINHLAEKNGIVIARYDEYEDEILTSYSRYPLYLQLDKKDIEFFKMLPNFISFLGEHEADLELYKLFKIFHNTGFFTALEQMNISKLTDSIKTIMAIEEL